MSDFPVETVGQLRERLLAFPDEMPIVCSESKHHFYGPTRIYLEVQKLFRKRTELHTYWKVPRGPYEHDNAVEVLTL